jgi:hypothetical protein
MAELIKSQKNNDQLNHENFIYEIKRTEDILLNGGVCSKHATPLEKVHSILQLI